MTRFVISAAALIALTMSASAEIICTDHGGCRETGRRIILGNGGGVNNSQTLVSHRGNKPQKVRIKRTIKERANTMTRNAFAEASFRAA